MKSRRKTRRDATAIACTEERQVELDSTCRVSGRAVVAFILMAGIGLPILILLLFLFFLRGGFGA